MVAPREGFERILRLAAYVGENPTSGCTIDEIAASVRGYGDKESGALARQLGRDIKHLEDSTGIVLEWSPEYQRYFLRKPMFTAKERQALLGAAGVVDVEGVGEHLSPGEIGAAVDADMAQVVVRVHHFVVVLRDAISSRRQIEFCYQGVDGASGVRHVDPYAVGLWRNRWYVVGHDLDRAQARAFRLDRIVAADEEHPIVAVGEASAYKIPPDFDFATALSMDPNSWGTDPPLVARVRVLHDHIPVFLAEFTGTVDEQDKSGATVTLEVRDYESFVIRLLGFGAGVELLAPPYLCEMLRSWLVCQAGD